MNNYILTFLLICLTAAPLTAQEWELLKAPLNNNITGIQLLGSDTILIISNKGDFALSTTGGRIWGGYQIAPNISLEDIYFSSLGTGFVCGSGGTVLKTNDTGRTWNSVISTDTSAWFFDVEMIDDKYGLVVGLARSKESPFRGIAFRTSDGGDSWQQINPGGMGYSELLVKNDTTYLVSFGKLNWSTNKGRSWESIITHEGSPARALSIEGKTYLLCGLTGAVYYSYDTGRSWYPAKQQDNINFVAAQMITDQIGYIAGGPAVLMKTTDGCRSWTLETMPKEFTIFDFYLAGEYLYAVGSDEGFIRKKVK